MKARPTALVLFDGVCNLCSGAVRWLIARDRRERLRFAALQSNAARDALAEVGGTGALPDSLVLVEDGRAFTRSDAVLRIASHLGLPWSLAGAMRVVPRPLRDGLYAWIARRRYAWFGRREACLAPTPATRERFADADEPTFDPRAPTTPPPRDRGRGTPAAGGPGR